MSSIRVYFDDFPLTITDENTLMDTIPGEILTLSQPENAIQIIRENRQRFDQAVILAESPKKAKDIIFRKYEVAIAGGGLVTDLSGNILVIFRKGHWDMPKGHLEPGETIEECAAREVAEETGLSHPEIINPLAVTFHTYFRKKKDILKENHWFLMRYPGNAPLQPQTEEGIKKAIWVDRKDISQYYNEMFPSIRDVIDDLIRF